ncbi:MAG: hypothetical protein Q4G10_04800 [Bacteroidia bacterium]|nr:hypothetical protein [Bacteroidia bacterium]
MKRIEHSYSILEMLLNEEHIFLNPRVSFSMICSWIGSDRSEMDDLLREELGLDGDELLLRLRNSVPDRLERKYSITVGRGPFF